MKIKAQLRRFKDVLPKSRLYESFQDSDDKCACLQQKDETTDVVDRLMRKASGVPFSIDAFELCRLSASLLQTPIAVIADTGLPKRAPGLLMRRRNGSFTIVYRPSKRSFSVAISILHELAHILLFHWVKLPVEVFWDRSFYTHWQEQDAERFAHQMMTCIIQKPQREISARFASLMPQKPLGAEVNRPADSQPARRFSALMPWTGFCRSSKGG